MKNNIKAIDSNILIYLHDKTDERKRKIAENILAENPIIPSQVISEYLNVTKRILDLSKSELLEQCSKLINKCEIIPINIKILSDAAILVDKYQFQLFDSIIVASALDRGCDQLLSEDMQNGLMIDNLIIINPFV